MRRLIVLLLIMMGACTPKPSGDQHQANASAGASSIPASATSEAPIAHAESAIAPEINPPGDIPDSQAFVNYQSVAGGYQLDVPEGWARTENGPAVTFVQRFDGVGVTTANAVTAPTVASVRANEARRIASSGHAVTITDVSAVTLSSGMVVRIRYGSNSEPNAVTNNRVRLDNETIVFFNNGKEAALTLWAPQGADNADQWNRMSGSFRWR